MHDVYICGQLKLQYAIYALKREKKLNQSASPSPTASCSSAACYTLLVPVIVKLQ